jgi:hypothetical protein
MAKLTLKINGKVFPFFNSFSYSVQIDAIASSISFNTYENFETFAYTPVQVFRDDVLIFTGEIIDKSRTDKTPPEPYNYKALSLTHVLSESTLPTEAYPLHLENSTLKDIVEFICGFFEVTVLFDISAESEANGQYKLSNLSLGEEASKIINQLVTDAGLILTHDAQGQLIITKEILQSEIRFPLFLSNNQAFDLTKFFHNYIALGQTPVTEDSDIQAIARFENIDQRRNTTKIQDSGDISTIEQKALGMRADSLKNIRQNLSFNDFFANVGDYVKLNDIKLVINQLDYSYNSSGEACNIGLLDSVIYER